LPAVCTLHETNDGRVLSGDNRERWPTPASTRTRGRLAVVPRNVVTLSPKVAWPSRSNRRRRAEVVERLGETYRLMSGAHGGAEIAFPKHRSRREAKHEVGRHLDAMTHSGVGSSRCTRRSHPFASAASSALRGHSRMLAQAMIYGSLTTGM